MYKRGDIILALLAVCAMFGFIGWALSLHGTIGMVRVDGLIRLLFVILGTTGVIPILLVLIKKWFNAKNRGTVLLSVLIIIFTILDIAAPATGFIYTSGFLSSPVTGITAPELILGYGTGSQGIPNVMVVTYTGTPVKESLAWGTTDLNNTIDEPKASLQHTFLLKDLAPGTKYRYQVGNGQMWSFKTPSLNSDLHIAIGSDTHIGAGNNRPDLTEKMLWQISGPQQNFDYFFSLGDIVEYGFNDNMWADALETFSQTTSIIPSGFVIGNHETIFTGLSRYEKYCRPDISSFSNGNNLRYRIDIGMVHILVLDLEWSAESYPAAQTAWLEQQLSEIPLSDWKIVMSHTFYYASGYTQNGWHWYDNPETINLYSPMFEKYGVNMVFSGHDHDLELLQHDGVTYVIDGGFGGIPDVPRTYTSPASLWYASGKYGYVDLTIGSSAADIVFRSPDGSILKDTQINRITR